MAARRRRCLPTSRRPPRPGTTDWASTPGTISTWTTWGRSWRRFGRWTRCRLDTRSSPMRWCSAWERPFAGTSRSAPSLVSEPSRRQTNRRLRGGGRFLRQRRPEVEHRREGAPVAPGEVQLRGQDGERDRQPGRLEEQVEADDVDDDRRQDGERKRDEQAAEEQQAGDDLGRLQQREQVAAGEERAREGGGARWCRRH